MDFYGCTQGNACAIRGRGNPRTIFTTQWKFWGEPCSTPPFHPGLHDLSQASWFGGVPRKSNEYKNHFEPITSWFRADVENDRDVRKWKSDCVGVVRVTNGIKSIHSHSLARPHSKGLRRCAAPQNTQPASLTGKLKHLFFLWWESFGRRGHFWKVWLRLESCANFEWLMFWCKLYFFGRLWIHSLPVGPYGGARTEAPLYQRWVPFWLFFALFVVLEFGKKKE